MMKLAKFALVVAVLAVFAVPMVSANEINDGGRCSHEAKIYQSDSAISEGLSVVTFASGGVIFDTMQIDFIDIAAALTDEDGDELLEAPDGLLFSQGDVRYFHSNNETPENFADDYVTISVLTAFDSETVACLFVFSFLNFDGLSSSQLTVYQQYPDGTTQELWLNAGN